MKKPVIGIVPLYDIDMESLWMLPCYLDHITKAGGIPLVLPLKLDNDDIIELNNRIDGYLLTGGDDVSPLLYNEVIKEYCGRLNPIRDTLESKLFKSAYDNDKPILGICRGIQFINAYLGGSLYQDLPLEFKGINHRMERPYNRFEHDVEILENTPLYDLIGHKYMGANTCHHQGIKELSPLLNVMAKTSDGLVEALYAPNKKFLWAVQWHPEMQNYDKNSDLIFEAFVNVCR